MGSLFQVWQITGEGLVFSTRHGMVDFPIQQHYTIKLPSRAQISRNLSHGEI